MAKKSAILIIGNEILSGKTADTNALYLTKELRGLGVEVCEIAVIPDDVKRIAEVVRDFSRRFHYVFTSGGVGPTHDDVTMQGIALAFHKKLLRHPMLIEILKSWYPDGLNEPRLKMAEMPLGSKLEGLDKLSFPVIICENVFIFPGIPEILREKFEAIKETFRDAPYYLKAVYLKTPEGILATHLNQLLKKYPKLMLGSYPEMNSPLYRVKVTLESKNSQYLKKAFQSFLESLPADAVIKIESEPDV